MSVPVGIDQALGAYSKTAKMTGLGGDAGPASPLGLDFKSIMGAIQEPMMQLKSTEAASIRSTNGSVSAGEVVESLNQAELNLSKLLAVRGKVIEFLEKVYQIQL